MADVKISQLPAATAPLAGTEEVPLVQSGVTKKATVNEIVAVAGAVTSVTATSPLASSGGSTPDISLTGVVDVAHGGTNATTASGARTNLGAAASGANSDITSMSGITGAIGTADYVAFDTAYSTTLAAGQLGWDGNNTLGLGMAGGNVIQHIGEDSFYYIKASSTITKGQVVMFTGAVGASGVPTGAPATGVTDGSYIMGVAAEGIANNAFGLVQFQGILRNVNTTGFADGDILWYDPAVTGGLTKTKPSAPNVKVQIAATINGGSAGGGTILVRVSAGSVLGGTDSNVQFSTLANGNIIQYDSALGYWKNVAPSSLAVTTFSGGTTGLTPATATAGAVTLDGTLAIANGGTGQTTANAAFNALAPSQTGNAGKYLTTDGTNTSWATNPLGTVTSVAVSGGTTGLTTSGGPITTSGTITLAGTLATTNGGTGLTSFTANGLVYASSTSALTTGSALTFDGTNTFTVANSGDQKVVVQSTSSGVNSNAGLSLTTATEGNWLIQTGNAVAGGLRFYNAGASSEGMRLTSTGLGIGTSSPGAKLHLYATSGTVAEYIENTGASGYSELTIKNSGASGRQYTIGVGGNTAGAGYANNLYFYDGTAGATRMVIDSSGNLGLGVTPSAYGTRGFDISAFVGLSQNSAGAAVFAFNNFQNSAGNYIYKTTNAAARYDCGAFGSAAHAWYTAPSGTAGNAISFTQAMTLDASGNLGIGTSAPAVKLQLNDTSEVAIAISTGGTRRGAFYTDGSLTVINAYQGNPLVFSVASSGVSYSEKARIDSSGNLGIGTSSPGSYSSYARNLVVSGGNSGITVVSGTTQQGALFFADGTTGADAYRGAIEYDHSANSLNFRTDGTSRLLLDSSGNLGLGVTPSAWSGIKAFEFGTGTANGSLYSFGNDTTLSANVYYNGGFKYVSTSTATRYQQNAGVHAWYTAPSGTAGNAISFTQAMTLDASGNLGVGETSIAADTRLHLKSAGDIKLKVETTNNTLASGNAALVLTTGSYGYTIQNLTTTAGSAGVLRFYDNTAAVERARIDSSGNLGVGTTSPAGRLDVVANNAGGTTYSYFQNNSASGVSASGIAFAQSNVIKSSIVAAVYGNDYMTFNVGSNTERARIDSSGNLLVGATSNVTNAARLLVQTASDYQLTLNASTASGTVYSAMNFTQAGAVKGAIYQDHANTRLTIQCNGSGGVYLASGATSWTSNSDERLKTDLKPIENAAQKVASLRAFTGRYKTDAENVSRAFLIAQDVQTVLPEAVTSGTLSRSDDETEYLGLSYTDTIPLLVAAIKEQQAIITDLRARVAQLESKGA